MEVMYLLIPASVLLALAVLAVFAWAVQDGQLDDLDQAAAAFDDSQTTWVDVHQVP
jgi:cbb3-type cytochrome oxidase maturation protein